MSTFPAGEQVLGRVLRADGVPLDQGATLDQAPRIALASVASAPQVSAAILETGIKVIDLFRPLRLGGLHVIGAGYGVGKEVVLAEIIHNLNAYHHGCAIWVAPRQQQMEGHHMAQSFRESGVLGATCLIVASPGQEYQALEAGLALGRSFALAGRPVILGVEVELLNSATASLVAQADSVTRLVIVHEPGTPALPQPLVADATVTFSVALAKQGIWPAVDVLSGSSRLIDDGLVDAEHLRVARLARETISHDATSPCAQRLLEFGSQPFATAEPFTARPGVSVPLAETIADYSTLLSGAYDGVAVESLAFQGRLPAHP